jgi:hypothetical protein
LFSLYSFKTFQFKINVAIKAGRSQRGIKQSLVIYPGNV